MMRKSLPLLICLCACAPAAAKDTGLIFVSNEKTNNIIVIDPKTYKITADIKVAHRPRDMHFNADHTLLYVACGDDDVIDILDVAKMKVVGKLVTGPSPEAFAVDEKRKRIYVSDEEASSLSIIDMEHNSIVQEVPTGSEPEGVLESDDGKTVYVTSEAGDLVHAIDAEFLITVDDNFGIAVGIETVSLGFELPPQLGEIVDLSVEDHPDSSVLVVDRLLSAFHVDDAEASHPQPDIVCNQHALIVRSPVHDGLTHRLHQVRNHWILTTSVYDTCNSAHE